MPWFSMISVYLWREGSTEVRKYERRITVCRAESKEDALKKLREEAVEYAGDQFELLDDYLTQEIDEPPGEEPVEVSHEMTIGINSKSGAVIEPEEFLRDHWDCSRVEDCEAFRIEHSWYNLDGENSACHNCEIVREGRFWEK